MYHNGTMAWAKQFYNIGTAGAISLDETRVIASADQSYQLMLFDAQSSSLLTAKQDNYWGMGTWYFSVSAN